MDDYQFIASLIASLAWPLAFVVAIICFWKPLRALIPRIREVELFGAHTSFGDRLQDAQDTAEKSTKLGADLSQVRLDDPYLELAERYPEAAVGEAYKEVLKVIGEYKDKLPFSPIRQTPFTLVALLADSDYIETSTFELFQKLKNTRNAAVHSGKITTGEAIEFRNLCHQLSEELRKGFEHFIDLDGEPQKAPR